MCFFAFPIIFAVVRTTRSTSRLSSLLIIHCDSQLLLLNRLCHPTSAFGSHLVIYSADTQICWHVWKCETNSSAARWSQHALAFSSISPGQASLEQPLLADHKTERTHAHTHTDTHIHLLPGLPHHFLPVRASSLLPGSGPHTEPTCFAMQCFCTGTKCQLTKSICAPPLPAAREREADKQREGEGGRRKMKKKWRKCSLWKGRAGEGGGGLHGMGREGAEPFVKKGGGFCGMTESYFFH